MIEQYIDGLFYGLLVILIVVLTIRLIYLRMK